MTDTNQPAKKPTDIATSRPALLHLGGAFAGPFRGEQPYILQ